MHPFFIMVLLKANEEFVGAPNGFDTRKIEKGEVFEASDDFGLLVLDDGSCEVAADSDEVEEDDFDDEDV